MVRGVLAGHEGQFVQRIIIAGIVAVIEGIVVNGTLGEGFLIAVTVVIVDGAFGGAQGVGGGEGHIFHVVVGILLLEDIVEIILIKGDFLSSSHFVGNVAGALAVDDQFHGALHAVAAAAVRGEGQRQSILISGRRRRQGQIAEGVIAVGGAAVIEFRGSQFGAAQLSIAAVDIALKAVIGAAAHAESDIAERTAALALVGGVEVAGGEGLLLAGGDGVGDGGIAGGGVDGVEGGIAGNAVAGRIDQTLALVEIPTAPAVISGPAHESVCFSAGGDFAGDGRRGRIAVGDDVFVGGGGAQAGGQIVERCGVIGPHTDAAAVALAVIVAVHVAQGGKRLSFGLMAN